MRSWRYGEQIIDSVDKMPKDVYGFVYLITVNDNGKILYYIGRKKIFSIRKKKFGKKKLAAMTDKRLKKYEMIKKESDWKSYTGSSKTLNDLIAEKKDLDIKREILTFAYNEQELKYREVREIICNDALLKDEFINDNVSIKQIGKPNFNEKS